MSTFDCQSKSRYHNSIDALNWLDTSGEQHALYVQAFELAKMRVCEFLARFDPSDSRRPCVFTDCDETILDNSAFNSWLVRYGRGFNDLAWDAYCRQKLSKATAGAVEFAKFLTARNVDLYYVTSRSNATRPQTAENLRLLGFPIDVGVDGDANADPSTTRLFMKGFKVPGGDRKFAHYDYVVQARGAAPILWMGDNLHDFDRAYNGIERTWRQRLDAAAGEHAGRWGRSWIVFPNPVYGDYLLSRWNGGERAKGLLLDDPCAANADATRKNEQLREGVWTDTAPKTNDLECWGQAPEGITPA
jgi:predicted secreted acid phosphatase